MRLARFAAPLACLVPLAACIDTTPEAQNLSGADAAEAAAVWDTRQPIAYEGKPVQVAMDPNQSYALVGYKDFGETVSMRQLTGVAAQATGCTATDESVLSNLTGPEDTPVQTAIIKAPGYLRVGLDC